MKAHLDLFHTIPTLLSHWATAFRSILDRSVQFAKRFQDHIPPKVELKIELWISLLLLVTLGILNFYGMFTANFYFGQVEDWLFIPLGGVHVWYLFHLRTFLKDHPVSKRRIRGLERIIYFILGFYGYMLISTLVDMQSLRHLENYIIADSFFIKTYGQIGFYSLLILVTLRVFFIRKHLYGSIRNQYLSENLQTW